MKKLLCILAVGVFISSCSNPQDKFVGEWSNVPVEKGACEIDIDIIKKDDTYILKSAKIINKTVGDFAKLAGMENMALLSKDKNVLATPVFGNGSELSFTYFKSDDSISTSSLLILCPSQTLHRVK